jgi:glutathione S-transferase
MSKPLIVYGSDASYFTGKLEAYLRAKGLAYRLEPFSPANLARAARTTGVMQIPQVECPDGSWLVDTTLIIDHFEATHPEPSVRAATPVARFVSRLLEDYADEWLWRPAMHYRWSYAGSARLMSRWLAEHAAEVPGPIFLKRLYWYARQRLTFVRLDGVTAATRAATEASFLETLDALEAIFRSRPFVLGERPTEADFGFFGPMFRHFLCDPVSGRIVRARAPGVQEWAARLWNLRPERFAGAAPVVTVAGDVQPLLAAVASVYLPYLQATAAAVAAGKKRVSCRVQGVAWSEPAKPYRVWCLAELQRRYAELRAAERSEVAGLLGDPAAAAILAAPPVAHEAPIVGRLPLRGEAQRKPVDSWWRRG